jgi:hypothetical protein
VRRIFFDTLAPVSSALRASACAAAFLACGGNSQSLAITLSAQGNAAPSANMTCNPDGGYSGVAAGSVTCTAGTATGSAQSGASAGHVGASADAAATNVGSTMSATAIYTDSVVFHNFLNSAAATTDVALNVNLTGTLSASGGAIANIEIRTTLNTFEIGHLLAAIDSTAPTPAQCSSSFAVGGCSFGSLAAGALVTQTLHNVPLDTAVLLVLRIDAGAQGSFPGASATSSFGQSLDFPIGTAVFVLPEGVTANAPDSLLVNNIFSPAGMAVTPLPGALPLFVTGLGALSLLGWRRKKKAAAHAE